MFDIHREAGGFGKGIDLTFKDVQPHDGRIEMRFVASVQMAKVYAIEINRQH